jgi:3-phosphoshikimate 1-carboxyvinyltransferase
MGNSGTTTRLLLGILAGQPFSATLKGDPSLSARPMRRVTEPLSAMGAQVGGPNGKDRLPLTIQGGALRGIRYALPVPSAQVKSALLLAGLFAQGPTTVVEPAATRDHTERILKRFGANLAVENTAVTVQPGATLKGQDLRVPGDISSAAFFLAAAAVVPGSRVTVSGVGLNPTRTGFLELLKRMGAKIEIASVPKELWGARNDALEQEWEPAGTVSVTYGPLKAITVEQAMVPAVIDELPIFLTVATQARGQTVVRGAGELRVKETDRIQSMASGLTALGAKIRVEGETITVEGPTPLKGAVVDSMGDHRTAMALGVAGLAAQGPTTVRGSEWVEISFPGFFETLKGLAHR